MKDNPERVKERMRRYREKLKEKALARGEKEKPAETPEEEQKSIDKFINHLGEFVQEEGRSFRVRYEVEDGEIVCYAEGCVMGARKEITYDKKGPSLRGVKIWDPPIRVHYERPAQLGDPKQARKYLKEAVQ